MSDAPITPETLERMYIVLDTFPLETNVRIRLKASWAGATEGDALKAIASFNDACDALAKFNSAFNAGEFDALFAGNHPS